MARPSVSEKYADHLASLLEAGEELTGVCAASEQQGMFKGRGVVLAVTDRRLLVVGLDRRGRPDGDAGPRSRPRTSPRPTPTVPAATGLSSRPRSWTATRSS